MHVIAVAPNHTSITSVTAAYDPKITHAQYGSGTKYGHVDLFELELDSTADTLTATLDGSVDWLTGGVVLKPDVSASGGSTLHILSRDDNQTLTVQETAWQTHSDEAFTIKRAYNDPRAWENTQGVTSSPTTAARWACVTTTVPSAWLWTSWATRPTGAAT